MALRAIILYGACTLLSVGTGAAQQWNTDPVLELVGRAAARRTAVVRDSGLQDYTARAQGFVLFMAQFGSGFNDPPRLVKADQIALDVFWRAPNASKQRIVGRRERTDLPTDIEYHRDHLGIVQNNFGNVIRLGDGHEVQNVRHPLSDIGLHAYDFALADSLTVRIPDRTIRVYEILVRPSDPGVAGVVGSFLIDVEAAAVVQFRFSFTKQAYLDDTVEDITITLDNGLWVGRYWLPRSQQIEIRRRSAWLDIPARGIIRASWMIDGYQFNVGLEPSRFRGLEIVSAPRGQQEAFPWPSSLDIALRDHSAAGPPVSLDDVRDELTGAITDRAISSLASARIGARSLSDFLRFNRVEGLVPGVGWVARPFGGAVEIDGWVGYGTSDKSLKARLGAKFPRGRVTWSVKAAREVRDLGGDPVISPLLNSFLAQELGQDFGDYYLREGLSADMIWRPSLVAVSVGAGWERTSGLGVSATPASGTFRENADLGSGEYLTGAVQVSYRTAGFEPNGISGQLALDGGVGEGISYLRARATADAAANVGQTTWVSRLGVGWASNDLPSHRAFVWGGRGTLTGEPFRQWGGASVVTVRTEWQVPVPVPEVRLGSFGSTGGTIWLAPYVGVGWAWRADPTLPWRATSARPVLGLAVEVLHRILRVEVGYSTRNRTFGAAADVRRDFWGIL